MKIDEIVTEAGILGTIGRGLGKAAMAGLRYLDKKGGGTGNVGTKAQQAEYKRKQMEKSTASMPKDALRELSEILKKRNIDIKNPATYPPTLRNVVQKFASTFFTRGVDGDAAQKVNQAILKQAMPTTLNDREILNYFTTINQTKNSIVANEIDPEIDKMLSPEGDVSSLVPDGQQVIFDHPVESGIKIVIRKDGYFLTGLPSSMPPADRARAKRDKATRMYQVTRPENIQQINQYYNDAADAGKVREEPIHTL